jgi:hypothetical protein
MDVYSNQQEQTPNKVPANEINRIGQLGAINAKKEFTPITASITIDRTIAALCNNVLYSYVIYLTDAAIIVLSF